MRQVSHRLFLIGLGLPLVLVLAVLGGAIAREPIGSAAWPWRALRRRT
jgi:hypothetical protein